MDDEGRGVERLYFLRGGALVQWNHRDEKPKELARYQAAHRGELPPYMPLPGEAVVFVMGSGRKRVTWEGTGPLPNVVLDYVRGNGTLPKPAGPDGDLGSDDGR